MIQINQINKTYFFDSSPTSMELIFLAKFLDVNVFFSEIPLELSVFNEEAGKKDLVKKISI